METATTEERLQTAFGQITAANAVIAALCRIHPDKAQLDSALKEFDAISMELLRVVERRYPASGQVMQDVYLQQMAGFRQAMHPD